MANIFDRLGELFGRKPERAEDTPPLSPQPPPAEATNSAVTTAEPAGLGPAETSAATAPAPELPPAAPPDTAPTYAPAAGPAPGPDTSTATAMQASPAPPVEVAPAPATTPMAAAAEPPRSAEQLETERLWAATDQAWAGEAWEEVVGSLTALRPLQPERSEAIDEKLAAAQYNWAAELERSGDLERASSLYRAAHQRNPNLGEAGFAIERLQAQLNPTAPAPEAAPATAERTYTVQEGDTLSAIAERFYGSADEWPRLHEANRDQIDNPELIQPGQTLRVP